MLTYADVCCLQARNTPVGTPLASPLGVRTASWKLASHTVKLNRCHGNVKEFEARMLTYADVC